VESALVLVLPPGNYTAIVTAATGTGVALLEVNDLRTLGISLTTVVAQPQPPSALASRLASSQPALEFCTVPIAVTLASR
jgi:hypothetical protein